MPIYEYRCKQGHTFEVMRRMTDGPVLSCETCSAPVQRVFRPIAVHFKGTGFYTTDYGSRKSAREREAGERAGEQAKAEGSKDLKDGSPSSDSKDSTGSQGSKESTQGSKESKDSKPAKSDSATSSTAKSSSTD